MKNMKLEDLIGPPKIRGEVIKSMINEKYIELSKETDKTFKNRNAKNNIKHIQRYKILISSFYRDIKLQKSKKGYWCMYSDIKKHNEQILKLINKLLKNLNDVTFEIAVDSDMLEELEFFKKNMEREKL